MHALDIVLAIVGVIFVVIGIKRGLIGEIIRLSAMVAGVFVAFIYYHDVAHFPVLRSLPLQIELKNAIAFILIYLLCAIVIITIGWIIKKIVHLTPLGVIDHILGGVIGGLKVLIIAYVACLSISTLPVRRIQNDFKSSIVLKTYQTLPKAFTLKSLLKKKDKLRTMFIKKPSSNKESLHKRIDKFKAVVDSAKEAQVPPRKE